MGNNKKKSNPFLTFLFAIVIPLVAVIAIVLIILSFTGFSVVEYVKKKDVPIISSVLPSEEDKNNERLLDEAETKIKKQKEEIESLLEEVSTLEGTVEKLEQDIVKLENKHESDEKLTEGESELEDIDTIKTMSASFKKMKSKQAALIFQDLEIDIAIRILEQLPNDDRGRILEAMEPKKAAQLTEIFINQADS